MLSFAIKKLVDLLIYRETVHLLIYKDLFHTDIFSTFMIWEEMCRLFVHLKLFVQTLRTA